MPAQNPQKIRNPSIQSTNAELDFRLLNYYPIYLSTTWPYYVTFYHVMLQLRWYTQPKSCFLENHKEPSHIFLLSSIPVFPMLVPATLHTNINLKSSICQNPKEKATELSNKQNKYIFFIKKTFCWKKQNIVSAWASNIFIIFMLPYKKFSENYQICILNWI